MGWMVFQEDPSVRAQEQGRERGAPDGGQGGIRTRGDIAASHAFQACAFDHSATCPRLYHRVERPFSLWEAEANEQFCRWQCFLLLFFGSMFPEVFGCARSRWAVFFLGVINEQKHTR